MDNGWLDGCLVLLWLLQFPSSSTVKANTSCYNLWITVCWKVHLLELPLDEVEFTENVACGGNWTTGFARLVLELEFPPHMNRVKLPKGFERKSRESMSLMMDVVWNLDTCLQWKRWSSQHNILSIDSNQKLKHLQVGVFGFIGHSEVTF